MQRHTYKDTHICSDFWKHCLFSRPLCTIPLALWVFSTKRFMARVTFTYSFLFFFLHTPVRLKEKKYRELILLGDKVLAPHAMVFDKVFYRHSVGYCIGIFHVKDLMAPVRYVVCSHDFFKEYGIGFVPKGWAWGCLYLFIFSDGRLGVAEVDF